MPSFGTDCSYVIPGAGIPSISSVYVDNYSQRPVQYSYQSLTSTFYGFGRSNYTTLEPALINITSQALYHYCQNNATCAKSYNSTAGIQQSLLNLVMQNSAKIRSALPADDSQTWVPSSQFANALSYFTVLPGPGAEIYGIHNGMAYTANNMTRSQVYAMYALEQRLTGGAEMFESLLNTVALVGLDAYANRTIYTKREKVMNPTSLNAFRTLRQNRDNLMEELANARGRERLRISELNMEANLQFLSSDQALGSSIDLFSSLETRAACDKQSSVQRHLSELQSAADVACGFLGIFAVPSSSFGQGPFKDVVKDLGIFLINHHIAQLGFINSIIQAIPNNNPAYPGLGFWSTDYLNLGSIAGYLQAAFQLGVTAAEGVSGAYGYISVACAMLTIAENVYAAASSCCASNCDSPSCTAASIACGISGPAC